MLPAGQFEQNHIWYFLGDGADASGRAWGLHDVKSMLS
jgi:hypothetical protein